MGPLQARRLRLLLVDDEADILLLLEAVLSSSPSWEVIGKATNGAAALRIAREIVPDLAIIDYVMPGMDGEELAQHLKEIRPECTVLVFSAFDVAAQADTSAYVDHFLAKMDFRDVDVKLQEIAREKGFAAD